EYKHIVLVKYRLDDDPNRDQERPLFEEIKVIGEITDLYAREKGTRVYLLKGAKLSINQYFKNEIENRRNNNY
ncbi:MAG: glycosyl transferase, partial [Bacteroidia bacterium]|nr:glycosyl transferase [Bacteroidia bacterium]